MQMVRQDHGRFDREGVPRALGETPLAIGQYDHSTA
jgi:hypothetical protein